MVPGALETGLPGLLSWGNSSAGLKGLPLLGNQLVGVALVPANPLRYFHQGTPLRRQAAAAEEVVGILPLWK